MRMKQKPGTQYVTFWPSLDLIWEIKKLARDYGVPYQSLMKIFLAEKVREEQMAWKKLQQ